MFCKTDKARVLLALMDLVRTKGRNIGRMEDRRMLAPLSRVDLDYVCGAEQIIRYRKRTERESLVHLSTYLEFDAEEQVKCIRIETIRQYERVLAEGWCATVNRDRQRNPSLHKVQISGDLDKMERDLSKLILCGDLVVE